MSRLPNRSVDLVVTSPPYNLGIRYRRYSDRQDRESYLQWCRKWAAQVGRILKSSGSFFLNIGGAPSNPMLPHEIAIELRDVFVLQNTIHWIKSIAINTAEGRTTAPNPHLNPLPGRSQVASNSIGSRLAFHIRTKATSPAGRTRAEATFAVAVTRGLFPMKRFRAARKSGRTPRLFRSNWLNGASICTEHRACIQCSTHFSVSGIQPWQLIAAA